MDGPLEFDASSASFPTVDKLDTNKVVVGSSNGKSITVIDFSNDTLSITDGPTNISSEYFLALEVPALLFI